MQVSVDAQTVVPQRASGEVGLVASAHWHQPGDTPDKLDYERMERHVTAVTRLVRAALDVTERPTWRDGRAAPSLEEMRVVHGLIGAALPKLDALEIQGPLRVAVTNFRAYLDAILGRGVVTPAERTNVRNTARMLFAQAVTLLR